MDVNGFFKGVSLVLGVVAAGNLGGRDAPLRSAGERCGCRRAATQAACRERCAHAEHHLPSSAAGTRIGAGMMFLPHNTISRKSSRIRVTPLFPSFFSLFFFFPLIFFYFFPIFSLPFLPRFSLSFLLVFISFVFFFRRSFFPPFSSFFCCFLFFYCFFFPPVSISSTGLCFFLTFRYYTFISIPCTGFPSRSTD